jgi:hypothetical protein
MCVRGREWEGDGENSSIEVIRMTKAKRMMLNGARYLHQREFKHRFSWKIGQKATYKLDGLCLESLIWLKLGSRGRLLLTR